MLDQNWKHIGMFMWTDPTALPCIAPVQAEAEALCRMYGFFLSLQGMISVYWTSELPEENLWKTWRSAFVGSSRVCADRLRHGSWPLVLGSVKGSELHEHLDTGSFAGRLQVIQISTSRSTCIYARTAEVRQQNSPSRHDFFHFFHWVHLFFSTEYMHMGNLPAMWDDVLCLAKPRNMFVRQTSAVFKRPQRTFFAHAPSLVGASGQTPRSVPATFSCRDVSFNLLFSG